VNPLECDGLVKRFGGTTALADVSFTCPAGSVTALIGSNGAGKSTLFLTAAGLLAPDGGTLRVHGHIAGTPGAQRALSLMPEQPDLYPAVSVWEHVTFMALLYRLTDWRPRAKTLLERFGLSDRLDAVPSDLSQGLRRRLALVMALVREADVMLLDEPFNGLDPRSANEVRSIVREVAAAGACVLVSTHVLSDVERISDRAIVLDRGSKKAEGTLGELRRQAGLPPGADLEASFLALTEDAAT
jgi:ABC-type multidrug transport system ATPase subunit